MIIKFNFRVVKQFHPIGLQINYLIIFCFFGILTQPTDLLAEGVWQLFEKNHEVTVYTRDTDEDVKYEFKAVVIIHQPIEEVGTVLMDVSTYMKWLDGCAEVKLINKSHDSNYEVYMAINAPWPFYDRDIIYKIKSYTTAKEERMMVRGIAIEKVDVPIRVGHVRVIDADFRVTLEKIPSGSTKVTYQSKTDVSCNAPSFLTKTICGNMVYNSMVNLKKLMNNVDINSKKEIVSFLSNESSYITNK